MRTFGLIGFPLGHSFSQRYFNEKFQREGIEACEYLNFPMEQIEGLTSLRQQYPSLCGFNVTIPHKQAILPYLAHLSPEAATIGAVNCVRVTPAGLIGYNTDALGFRSALLHLLHGAHPAKALVLGSGGASEAVHFVLQQLEIASIGVSRQAHSGGYTYESLTPE
ncbi:MAG: shikimate dehydrogenase, partial [Alistipes sp.]|nr:shikimate dehydrogenase [Alistipes sp.]